MNHCPGHFKKSSNFSFHHYILLRCYRSREFMENPFQFTKLIEAFIFKLSVMFLWMRTMPLLFLRWSCKYRAWHTLEVIDFSRINFIHVYREKSSTHTIAYHLPPRLLICIGLIRSIWKSSSVHEVVWWVIALWDDFIYFPAGQPKQHPCILKV